MGVELPQTPSTKDERTDYFDHSWMFHKPESNVL